MATTFSDIIEQAKTKMSYRPECMQDYTITIAGTGGGASTSTTTPNPAWAYITAIITALTDLNNIITNCQKSCINNLEQKYGETQNFSFINSYANASKNIQLYDANTDTFSDQFDYYYTRGHIYQLMSLLESGDWLNTENYINLLYYADQILGLINITQADYDSYSPVLQPGYPKQYYYWTTRLAIFTNALNKISICKNAYTFYPDLTSSNSTKAKISAIILKNIFEQYYNLIYNYIKVYQGASTLSSLANQFVDAYDLTAIKDDTTNKLDKLFADITQPSMQKYSGMLGLGYTCYTTAVNYQIKSSIEDSTLSRVRQIILSESAKQCYIYNSTSNGYVAFAPYGDSCSNNYFLISSLMYQMIQRLRLNIQL